MSLTSSTSRQPNYTGNDSASEFDYGFKIFSDSDLLVAVLGPDLNQTTLVLDTDYTVDGAGDAAGGSITLIDAGQDWLSSSGYLDTDYLLAIRRVRPLTQLTRIRNQGDYYPETLENVFDHLVMIDQQQQDELDRSIKNPESVTTDDFDPTLPDDIATASCALVTNPLGDGWVLGPTVDEISNAQTYATEAGTSEGNAATSAAAAASSASSAATSAAAAAASATSAASTESQEVPSGTINGSNTAFTLAHAPLSASAVKIFQDGLFLRQGTDYTISGANITMTTAPEVGQTLDAVYRY